MKNMGKYILIGIGVVVIEWIFLAFFSEMFNGLSQEDAIVTGAAFFLAFEMVICTGAILSKLKKNKQTSS